MNSALMSFIVIYAIYFACVEGKHVNITCPTEFCTCNQKKAFVICSSHGKNLTYIPKLPGYVRRVTFDSNYLPNITKLVLRPLKFLNMSDLHLVNNSISYIERFTFHQQKQLFYLDLSGNPRLSSTSISLTNAFKSLGPTKIAMISLNDMNWTSINSKLFSHLPHKQIIRVELSNNKLSAVDMGDFGYLIHLTYLDLSFNGMVKLTYSKFSRLENLLLSENGLQLKQSFCSKQGPYFPKLKTLDLKFNSITDINPKTFDCLPKLKNLILSANPISHLRDNSFSCLPRLEMLRLSKLVRKPSAIAKFAFRSSSLLNLIFDSNRFEFRDGTYSPKHIFGACPNLTSLDLSGNIVPQDSDKLIEMLTPLKNLQHLTLQAVKWRNIPINFLSHLSNLTKLNLPGNKISLWDNSTFANVFKLEYLDLSSNSINLINKTSFPPELLKSIKRINLAKNPFTCTCDLMWFRNWVKNVNFSLYPFPDYYKCISPPSLKGKLLIDFNPTEESCAPPKQIPIELIAIVSSAAVVAVIVVAMVTYRCRWHIRYGLYLLRTKKRGYLKIKNAEEFVFDGFVVYSDDDREWVHEQFLKRMEEEEGIKLCVHYRDFEVGKLIVDNIADSMYASRKVCLIISNNFAKRQWCKFELLLAQDRFLNEGTELLVLVMFEEIEHRNLNKALKALVTSTTYAMWSDETVGQQLFWEQIISAFKTPLELNGLRA